MVALLATSVGLPPERIDLTHGFATWGAGAVLGDAALQLDRRGVLAISGDLAFGWLLPAEAAVFAGDDGVRDA